MSTFANPPRYAAETAREYVAALLAILGDQDPMEVLAATPAALRGAAAGMSHEGSRTPEKPGKWSVQQVVRHLADSELVYGYRIRLIVAAEHPAIPGTTRTRGRAGSATTMARSPTHWWITRRSGT